MVYSALISLGVKESMRQQVTEVETPEPSNQATEERAICTPVETKKPGNKYLDNLERRDESTGEIIFIARSVYVI